MGVAERVVRRDESATAVNWLRELLKDWAAWDNAQAEREHPGHGWSDSTPLWHAAHSAGGGTFGSRVPPGVEPPAGLRHVVSAMIVLRGDPVLAYPVNVMRTFYTRGAEVAAAEFHVSAASVAVLRNQGEMALRAYLRA